MSGFVPVASPIIPAMTSTPPDLGPGMVKATGQIVARTLRDWFIGIPDGVNLAPLVSPALTGAPTVPTAAVDTATTQIASTAFVTGQAASATSPMDGAAAAGTSTRYARQDHVHPVDTSRAPLASPTFTGSVAAPTVTTTAAGSSLVAEAWIAPTLLNSWVNFGGVTSPVGYYKDATGRVWLRGVLKSGTLNTSAFTLPAGYRPAYDHNTEGSDTATAQSGRCAVLATGGVVLGNGGVGANTFFSIDGISFRAEQ